MSNERSPRAGPAQRNAERTRASIVAAARQEFVRSGFEGARVSAIARRAGVTTSLIFYYFKNKDGLYRAMSEERLASYAPSAGDKADESFNWPLWLFRLSEGTHDAVRIVLREGILTEPSHPPLVEEKLRYDSFQEQVERVRAAQAAGQLPDDLDPAQLTLFLYVLGVCPYVLPQTAHLITGAGPTDPAFRSGFETFLKSFLAAMRPSSRPADA